MVQVKTPRPELGVEVELQLTQEFGFLSVDDVSPDDELVPGAIIVHDANDAHLEADGHLQSTAIPDATECDAWSVLGVAVLGRVPDVTRWWAGREIDEVRLGGASGHVDHSFHGLIAGARNRSVAISYLTTSPYSKEL